MFSNESLIYDEVFFFIKKRSLIQFIFITSGLPLFTGLLFMVLDYIYNSELTIAIIIGIILMGWIFELSNAVNTVHRRFSIIITEKDITIAREPFFKQKESCVYQLDRVLKIDFYADAPVLIFVDKSEFDNWITANLPKQFFTYLHEHRNIKIE